MFIPVGDAQIYTTSFGPVEAPPLIGIGGWIGSWELWAEPFAILSQTWRTIAYDHRGTGATLAPTGSITFEQLVDDVFAVQEAYGIEALAVSSDGRYIFTSDSGKWELYTARSCSKSRRNSS